jgi:hypothetical protein
MTGWIIAAAELRIPRETAFAAHRMIVVADPKGDAARQINGLASWFDRRNACWRHKPIGYLASDRLRGYDTQAHPRTFLPINGVQPGQRSLLRALETGAAPVLADRLSKADVEHVLAPALAALTRINALSKGPEGGAGLPYPFMGFGRNSNSFFSTLLRVMDVPEPAFARPAVIVPGAKSLLLPLNDIAAIRARYSSSSTSGVRNSASASAIASTPSAVG